MSKKSVLIIGGGVAGFAAGIYALKNGCDAAILEQHKIAGGNLTGWNRKGCHIDNCIHWLTGTNKHSDGYPIWKDTGVLDDDTEIVKPEALFSYRVGDKTLSLYRNLKDTVNEMLQISPEDRKEIKRFERIVKKAMFFSNVGGENNDKALNLGRLFSLAAPTIRFHLMTCGDYGKRFHHPLLQGFFSCLTGPDFSMMAFVLTAANFCAGNADLPKGGSMPTAQRMLKRFKELGGTFIPGVKVAKINTYKNLILSVEDEAGKLYEADEYISTIDPKMLFGKLINIKMPKRLSKIYKDEEHRRFSFLHAAFMVPKDKLRFKGTVIFDTPEACYGTVRGDKIIAKEFSYEEKSAPAGYTVVQLMSYIYEDECKKWIQAYKMPARYEEMKSLLANAFSFALTQQYPELKDSMELLDVWTPASYVRYVGSEIGSFMSFTMPAKKIPKVISGKVRALKNLHMATQWQIAPGGLPIAAKVGKLAAKKL